MISERTTLIRLIALWLALAPLPAAFGGTGASLSPLNRGRVIGGEVAISF